MKEKWKSIVVDGKVYEGYSISNYGIIISHSKKHNGKIIKPRKQNRGMSISLVFPKGFFW